MPAGARACPSCGGREARWVARYRGPDRVERAKWFARRADAQRFLHDREARKARGEGVDPELGKTPLSEWVERWRGTTVHLKPKTRAGYESLLKTLILPEPGRARLGGRVGRSACWPRPVRLAGSPGVRAPGHDHAGGRRVRVHRPIAVRECPA